MENYVIDMLLAMLVGSSVGTLVGMIPGFGPTTAIALSIPFITATNPYFSLPFVASIYYATQYGGSTTAILLGIPGESSSVVTALEGQRLNKHGRAGSALFVAAVGSFFAGTTSALMVFLFSKVLVKFSILFTPVETFCLSLLGLYFATTIFSKSKILNLYGMILGILLGSIGIHTASDHVRFTYGSYYLYDGLNFIIVISGLIGGAEIITNLLSKNENPTPIKFTFNEIFKTKKEKLSTWFSILRGSVWGSLLGLVPGGGGTIASFFSYSIEKKFTKGLGQGKLQGVAAPESANNAAVQSGFIPLFALGIPENAVFAIILGLMNYQGVIFGQAFFNNGSLFNLLIVSMVLGNLLLLIFNLPLIKYFVKIYKIPQKVIFSFAFCSLLISIFYINHSIYDVLCFMIFSILGMYCKSLGVPTLPIVMGFIIGPIVEDRFIKSLIITDGNFIPFLTNYVTLGVVAVISIVTILKLFLKKNG